MKVIVLTTAGNIYIEDYSKYKEYIKDHQSLRYLKHTHELGMFSLCDNNISNIYASHICKYLVSRKGVYTDYPFIGTALLYDNGSDMTVEKFKNIQEHIKDRMEQSKSWKTEYNFLVAPNKEQWRTAISIRKLQWYEYFTEGLDPQKFNIFITLRSKVLDFIFELSILAGNDTRFSSSMNTLSEIINKHNDDNTDSSHRLVLETLVNLFNKDIAIRTAEMYELIYSAYTELYSYTDSISNCHPIRLFLTGIYSLFVQASNELEFLFNLINYQEVWKE